MSEALQISNYSGTFVDTVSSTPLVDLKKSSGNTTKVLEKAFKIKRTITSESSAMGTDHIFSIPASHGYVSHLYFEVQGTNSVVYDFGEWALAGNIIKQVKVEIGSEIMCTYSGVDLVKMIKVANRSSNDAFEELRSISGNDDTNADIMLIPLLAPGSNLVHSLDAFDVRCPAFPIGACNNPMVVTVTLQTGAYASTNALVINAPKLNFFTYAVDEPRNISNKQPSNTGVYYSWVYCKPISTTQSITLVANTENQFVIDNIITQGELEYVLIDFLIAAKATSLDFCDSSAMSRLALKVRGTEILYEHTNVWEGRLNFLRDFKCINKLTTTSGYGYLYGMTTTLRPDLGGISGNIGSKGINLNLNKPTVFVTDTVGGTYTIRPVAMYKALYNVNNDKTAKTVLVI